MQNAVTVLQWKGFIVLRELWGYGPNPLWPDNKPEAYEPVVLISTTVHVASMYYVFTATLRIFLTIPEAISRLKSPAIHNGPACAIF